MKKLISIFCVLALMLTASVTVFAAENYSANQQRVVSALQGNFRIGNYVYSIPSSTIQQAANYLGEQKHQITSVQADKIVNAIRSVETITQNTIASTGDPDLKKLPTAVKKSIHTLLTNAAPDGQIFSSDGSNLIIVDKDGSGYSLSIPVLNKIYDFVIIDTGRNLTVEAGKTYQFKVTAPKKPIFVSGNSSVFKVVMSGSKGNDYFFKVTAVGKAGQGAGFYVNGEKSPRTIGTIVPVSVKLDTGKQLNVKAGKTYQFKVTSSVKPTFVCGSKSIFTVVASGSKGNDYFFKVTAIGKVGQCAGFYVNGEKSPRTLGAIVQ